MSMVERHEFDQLHRHLHDLCQPLTALQCRLEVGRMLHQEHAVCEIVDDALEETRRMFAVVNRMREWLQGTESFVG